MKFKIVVGLACLIAVCIARPAEDYEYEDGAAAAPAARPAARPNPLLNRRNPLSRNPAAAKPTTSTTQAPEEEVEEEIAEDIPEEEAAVETSSTTETGRRLKGGIVRPFRSNQELLDTLKKRREQAVSDKANAKANGHEPQESAPGGAEHEKSSSKARPSSGGRGRFSKKENAAPADDAESSSTARSNGGRRFRN